MSNNQNSIDNIEREQPKLSAKDLERVEKYLSSPIHQVERKPFRPWIMMLMLVVTVTLLSGLSVLLTKFLLS